MEITCNIEKRISKKTGNEYVALVVPLGAGLEKLVFLSREEIALLSISQNKR